MKLMPQSRYLPSTFRPLITAAITISGLTSSFLMLASSEVLGAVVGDSQVATDSGQPFIVDQSNTSFDLPLFQSLKTFAPLGQEFTPTLSSLNVVELYSTNFGKGNSEAVLSVDIRKNTITGPIIGSSSKVRLIDDFVGPTRFDFSSSVPLVPDSTYVIDVINSGRGDAGIGSTGGPDSTYTGGPASLYPGGNEILRGLPQSDNDLFFEEGITAVPEPSSISGILTFGTLGAGLLLKRGRRQKSI